MSAGGTPRLIIELGPIKKFATNKLFRQGTAMGKTRSLFLYKCVRGHLTEKTFPLGTRYDEYDETTCLKCLEQHDVKAAYLIYAKPTNTGAK